MLNVVFKSFNGGGLIHQNRERPKGSFAQKDLLSAYHVKSGKPRKLKLRLDTDENVL